MLSSLKGQNTPTGKDLTPEMALGQEDRQAELGALLVIPLGDSDTFFCRHLAHHFFPLQLHLPEWRPSLSLFPSFFPHGLSICVSAWGVWSVFPV